MEYINGVNYSIRDFEQASAVTATINNIKETKKQSFHGKRSLRTHNLSHEVDGGFVAFTTDYHPPRHHPPKNNK